ncbi:MAG: gamma-glutamyl-gamma-aminobutyrate hydrolase family protein [Chloroflexi bacterium]|nr:gamma-glutamyl-gamma-aminobutyrate hydrolase family protein [Chloroflexota bacterium]
MPPSRIAVTMRVVDAEGYHEPRDAISHDWILFLRDLGCEPVLVPNLLANPVSFVERAGVHAMLLTNGEDVRRSRTGNDASVGSVGSVGPSNRDDTEFALLDWALGRNLPVLAVCRGLHLVNVYFGGSVVREIEQTVNGALNHVATLHNIQIIDATTRNSLKTEGGQVNSFHRHGISDSTLGDRLVPFAKASDEIIEAFYVADKPVLAIQWHPERPGPRDFCQRNLAVSFLMQGAWWHVGGALGERR